MTLRSDDGEEETWILVSPQEANTLDGRISTQSPVGQAADRLPGRRFGNGPTPGGAIVYTVVAVA